MGLKTTENDYPPVCSRYKITVTKEAGLKSCALGQKRLSSVTERVTRWKQKKAIQPNGSGLGFLCSYEVPPKQKMSYVDKSQNIALPIVFLLF